MTYWIRSSFFLLLFLFIFIQGVTQDRKVSNIFFRAIEDKIEIFYDLPRNYDTLNVIIYFRKKSDPKTRYPLKSATGSIGIGRFSGKKLKVVWNYKKEPPYLFTGNGFYYEIIAEKVKAISINKNGIRRITHN